MLWNPGVRRDVDGCQMQKVMYAAWDLTVKGASPVEVQVTYPHIVPPKRQFAPETSICENKISDGEARRGGWQISPRRAPVCVCPNFLPNNPLLLHDCWEGNIGWMNPFQRVISSFVGGGVVEGIIVGSSVDPWGDIVFRRFIDRLGGEGTGIIVNHVVLPIVVI
mmetsp:Transcript_30364/g.57417  ORF Transcript_30364/g.57417 Transcript_30364/m.57417 type:complete len:165 (-) Transcript_30364:3563-4057(-)